MEAPQQATAVKSKSRSSSQSPRPKKSRPVDPLDALGLTGFARALGVAPDSVLAATATLLTGIAGPDAWIQSPWGGTRLSKLDLLTSRQDSRMQRLIDSLTEPLHLMNRRLSQNMNRFDRNAIELLTAGPFSNPVALKHADQEMRDKSLRSHADALLKEHSGSDLVALRGDLAFDPVNQRKEAMTHPQFILRAPGGCLLKSLVEDCHCRSALVIKPILSLTRQGSHSARVMKVLTSLIDGVVVKPRPGPRAGNRDPSLTAKAQVILSLPEDELEIFHSLGPEVAGRFLKLAEGSSEAMVPRDGDASARFYETFQRASEEILDLRRKGHAPMIRFSSGRCLVSFENDLRTYESEIAQLGVEPGPWARGLPQVLFWALRFLERSMPEPVKLDDEALAAAAFAAARRLVVRHAAVVKRITEARMIEDRCRLAKKMVEEVIKHPGYRFFELVRAFSCQKKSRFEPVIQVLLDAQVLVIGEDKRFSLGPVEYSEAEESVREAISRL